jgi:hypothetical protein
MNRKNFLKNKIKFLFNLKLKLNQIDKKQI